VAEATAEYVRPAAAPEPPPAPDADPEWSVCGYELERKLGEGGMGIVYRALRVADGATVAIKTIAPAMVGATGAIARFLRGAGVLRQFEHPNIVRFEQMGQSEGRLFCAMESVPGVDVDRLLRRHGRPLAIRTAADLIGQVLEALAYAHDLGFVHRDIKPRNV